ncbi:MAG: hypothetical protein RLY31_2477 [Bacteroidota bacterium]|jgi:biopolymer transport protein ExbD
MGLRKRNKVSTQFSTASMTDMIFLLLIFFVLNSGLVAPNSLNLKLPGSSRTMAALDERTDDIAIHPSGKYYLNGKRVSASDMEDWMQRKSRGAKGKFTVTISPRKGAQVQHVAFVMDVAMRFQVNAVLTAAED